MDQEWLKTGGDGFFPAEIGALMQRFGAFGVARWNFLVYEPPPGSAPDWTRLEAACGALKVAFPPPAYQFQCQLTRGANAEIATEWARDLPLRQPMPGIKEVQDNLHVTMAKAAMPLGPELVGILRADPFAAYESLLARLESQKLLPLTVKNDFLTDADTGRVLIPMNLGHQQLDADKTQQVEDVARGAFGDAPLQFLGGHFAALENRDQVVRDLSSVSGLSIACLVATLVVMKLFRQLRLLLVLVPVILGSVLAALAIVWKDGSIHGLTLSFGSGVIGLSVDYGAHAIFHGRRGDVWRSNAMGLATTLAVLGTLAFSAIPLLRQLILFSILGLIFSFGLIYLAFHSRPAWFDAEPLRVQAWRSRVLAFGVWGLVLAGLFGLAMPHQDLSLQRLSYMSSGSRDLAAWFRKSGTLDSLFVIHDDAGPALFHELTAEVAWAKAHGIRIENAAQYLPPVAEQEANRKTWFDGCEFAFASKLSPVEKRFFAPFAGSGACHRVVPQTLAGEPVPAYVRHLSANGQWISIFFPEGEAATAAVREAYPEAFSMVEIANRFPALFRHELAWMTPVALGSILLILTLYFRSGAQALAALLPFLAGAGAIVVTGWVTQEPLNFVTLIAMLILCGLSVDYGVFAVDEWRSPALEPDRTHSALVFCSLATALGMLPMVFAQHPVLKSLGLPLMVGILGALLGAVLCVPGLLGQFKRRHDAA